jgi:diguanylate cyclase (GGDEF)-like protein
VDHFKRINDTFGHDVGDAVLRRVAQAARGALRHDDHIGRTGGEEFVVVLPHADAGQAVDVAERLRVAVERLDWSDVDAALRVTVSVGAAERVPADGDFAALARRADDSLYRAKEAGRNRVALA